MTGKTVNEVLELVIDRSEAQKALRLAQMRAELIELGYSIVTTEWLRAVLKENPMPGMRGEAAE